MKIILAPDSFKGSLSAQEVVQAMTAGARKICPEAEIIPIPMADGGEGSIEAVLAAKSGQLIKVEVRDPLMRPIQAEYALLNQGKTALIEMAKASGLLLLDPREKNPMLTTTYGTGELIKNALANEVEEIILCIGGSATNDAGAGMLQALGAKLLDAQGQEMAKGGGALRDLHQIDWANWHAKIAKTKFTLACDVNNPLLGANGASYVYGPQKGANAKTAEQLDQNLEHFTEILRQIRPFTRDYINAPGAGAAGGLGFAIMSLLGAEVKLGVKIIAELNGLETHIKAASQEVGNLLLTGEGQIDAQSLRGKVPWGVAQMARLHHLPVVAIVGSMDENLDEVHQAGIQAVFSIINHPMSLEEAIEKSASLIQQATENILRLWKAKS